MMPNESDCKTTKTMLRTVTQFDGDVFTINDGMETTDEESPTMYRETRSLEGLGG